MKQILCLVFLFSATLTAADYQKLYVFGDSYSDTGAGYIDGNGPTAVGYLADRMKIKLLPANDAEASRESSLNFAVSGAGTGRGSGRKVGGALLGYGMENQVEDFVKRVKENRTRFNPKRTLFFIAGGLNDSRLGPGETLRNLEGEIRSLYGVGARHFEVAVLPEAIPSFHDVAVRLNSEIAKIPGEMAHELTGIDIRLSQWGPYFDDVKEHPAQYGFENTKDRCAGRAIFNEDTTPCANPGAYYYYHAGHPSTAVHKVVGAKLYEELAKEKGRRE